MFLNYLSSDLVLIPSEFIVRLICETGCQGASLVTGTVGIGSDNGLVPSSSRASHEPVLTRFHMAPRDVT